MLHEPRGEAAAAGAGRQPGGVRGGRAVGGRRRRRAPGAGMRRRRGGAAAGGVRRGAVARRVGSDHGESHHGRVDSVAQAGWSLVAVIDHLLSLSSVFFFCLNFKYEGGCVVIILIIRINFGYIFS